MKSFGSTLDRSGSSLGSMFEQQNTGLWYTKKNNFFGKVSNAVSQKIGSALLGTVNSKLNNSDYISESESIPYNASRDTLSLYKDNSAIDIGADNKIGGVYEVTKAVENLGMSSLTEDTMKWNQDILDRMNWYNFSAGAALNTYDTYTEKGETKYRYAEVQKVVHSLFNPYYGIDPFFGMGNHQYIAAQVNPDVTTDNDPNDCRISTLVKLSQRKYSILGQARYKYADFMFCKELGMPNNHLITLRRYASPVGDRIHGADVVNNTSFTDTSNKSGKPAKYWSNNVMTSDIGHICCYFGGEDNKLEDILKYSFKQTYKNMQSTFDMVDSQEDNRQSPLGMLINSTSKNYNAWMSKGVSGDNNLVTWAAQAKGGMLGKIFGQKGWYNASSTFFYRDKNKIYEPKNTIQEVDYYEGKLQFTHEFSIVFSYKLRSYDNISPKMAMLDLIANIVRTCYSRGTFWGGRRQINGAQPNASSWNKANAFIDKTWDKLGSGLSAFLNGNFNFSEFLGKVSGLASDIINGAKETATKIAQGGVSGVGKTVASLLTKLNKKTGIGGALKGALKNAVGRPQWYAMDSLLTGGNTGVWHLTIGNPLRPIITIGNLEVTNTEIQHLGPLGIDDFPTELKVTVSFKHARPRDAVDIEKMYMFGDKSIYKTHVRTNPGQIYTIFKDAPTDFNIKNEEDAYEQEMTEMQKQADADAARTKEENDKNNKEGSGTTQAPKTDAQKKAEKAAKKKKEAEEKARQDAEEKAMKEANERAAANASNIINDPNNKGMKWNKNLGSEETDGLDYIGEWDFQRMRANMDELA